MHGAHVHPPTPLLRERRYLLWWAGDSAQALGVGLGSFAMPLLVVQLTGSAAAAGTIGAIQLVGAGLGLLPGGVLADRHDRRRLRSLSALIGLTLSLGLVTLLLTDSLTPTLLATIGFAMYLRASLFTPASESMLRTVAGKQQIAQAVANNQGRDAAVGIVAGPIGGVLYAIANAVPFAAEAVCWLVMWATNLRVSGDHRPQRDGPPTSPWRDLVTGLRFVQGRPLLRSAMLTFMLVNLAANGAVSAVIMNLQLSGRPPQVIGLVSLVIGLGALVGAVIAGALVRRIPTGVIVLATLLAVTAGLIGVALAPGLGVALAALAGFMMAAPALNAALGGLLMHVVPNELLGRVESVIIFGTTIAIPFGPALAGWGIELLGYRRAVTGFAAVAALSMLSALASPALRRLPASDRWSEVEL